MSSEAAGPVQAAALSCVGLSKRYGDVRALRDVSLEVHHGEVTAVVGVNGAGKSTLQRVLAGLVRADGGETEVLGRPPGDPQALRSVGVALSSTEFYPWMTGASVLRTLARWSGSSDRDADEAADRAGVEGFVGRRVKTYSTGMRRRLALAAALIKSPQVLLLDEPFDGVDPLNTEGIVGLLDRLRAEGVAVLLATHMVDVAERAADRVCILHEGRVADAGTVAEVRAGHPSLRDAFLHLNRIGEGRGLVGPAS